MMHLFMQCCFFSLVWNSIMQGQIMYDTNIDSLQSYWLEGRTIFGKENYRSLVPCLLRDARTWKERNRRIFDTKITRGQVIAKTSNSETKNWIDIF